MKKLIHLILIAFVAFLSFSFITPTPSVQAKLTEAEDRFIKTITDDFIDTHNLNLNGYSFFDIGKISPSNKTNLTQKDKTLTNIFMDIAKDQNYVDCSPIFYIDETNTKGYVLEKKLSGMNNLYNLTYDNTSETWKITEKVNKMGKDLVDLGLVKGTE
ncbi:hypothetical protein AB3Z07_26855 (plasmid) [Metabacillus halosaccharovorans]|uniref:hypothetical protein n=1 Tax=Metabacillus halosaccharovorans TaxID=930124 RepID=UPI0020415917|nr:hypothetical protein [Metabacillus halosaccharovorans]MCM3444146.1 hypothetical protein [Metabacillus halosaccharovorans]